MPPIITAIAAVAGAINAVVTTAAFAIGLGSATAIGAAAGAFTTFVLKTALVTVGSRLLSPKAPKAAQAERQASIVNLTLGESPREAIFGTACTGGTLIDAFNYGTSNQIECLVIALADHECDSLVGYFVNDKYVAWPGDGVQAGFNNKLTIYFLNGAQTTASQPLYDNAPGGRWTTSDILLGITHAIVFYEYDEKTWTTGRPSFRWVVKGAKLYDPRKDSTVAGGSGAHRWGSPATYEWTENAAVCRYNYQRGMWTRSQLLVGPGRSSDEAPPDAVIAAANVCDENVTLKAGGTEKRYRVGCVVRADEKWIDVEEAFTAAMAGDLVERSGALFIDPGVAKSVVFTFTDDDLLFDQAVTVQAKVSRRDLVNTVAAAYIEPSRLWQSTSAPLRRASEDITADGEVRELPLDLRFVTSQTQAQRIGEIERRRRRLQRSASVVLGPAACVLEAGDWVTWTSARYFGGGSRTFQVVEVTIDEALRTALQLREIASSVYSWTAATDELDLQAPVYVAPSALPAATISGFTAAGVALTGGGSTVPALALSWTAPTDPSIYAITFEWRKYGTTDTLKMTYNRPRDGSIIIAAGITATTDWEVRAIPETDPERDETPTAWRTVTTGSLTTALAAAIAGQGALATQNNVALGTNRIVRADGSTTVTESLVVTSLGTAGAITGQGGLATRNDTKLGDGTVKTSGGTTVNDADAITSLGTAAGIAGQGVLATLSLPSYAGNAAAIAGGLGVGRLYIDTSDSSRVKAVVGSTGISVSVSPAYRNGTRSGAGSLTSGTFTIAASGGTSPYRYWIQSADGLATISGAASSVFTVTASLALGETKECRVVVNVWDANGAYALTGALFVATETS